MKSLPCLLGFALALNSCSPPARLIKTPAQERAERIELLDSLNRNPGRYTLLSVESRIFKLDTVSGKAWQLLKVPVINTNVTPGRLSAEGWHPISDDLAAALEEAQHLGTK